MLMIWKQILGKGSQVQLDKHIPLLNVYLINHAVIKHIYDRILLLIYHFENLFIFYNFILIYFGTKNVYTFLFI